MFLFTGLHRRRKSRCYAICRRKKMQGLNKTRVSVWTGSLLSISLQLLSSKTVGWDIKRWKSLRRNLQEFYHNSLSTGSQLKLSISERGDVLGTILLCSFFILFSCIPLHLTLLLVLFYIFNNFVHVWFYLVHRNTKMQHF